MALSVAGHLHGGQVNLPLIRRAMLPTRYGERYLAGHVVEGGRHLYVSAGLGTSGSRCACGARPRWSSLTLRAPS